jgi:hypothetical protein
MTTVDRPSLPQPRSTKTAEESLKEMAELNGAMHEAGVQSVQKAAKHPYAGDTFAGPGKAPPPTPGVVPGQQEGANPQATPPRQTNEEYLAMLGLHE